MGSRCIGLREFCNGEQHLGQFIEQGGRIVMVQAVAVLRIETYGKNGAIGAVRIAKRFVVGMSMQINELHKG
jgi:hypothetical protein